MGFDYEGAKAAGYSDDHIADYLGKSEGFDVAGARKAGYSGSDIVKHLTQNRPPAPETSSFARRALGDTAVSTVKGAVGLVQSGVGIADIATGGHVGKAIEDYTPIQLKQTQTLLDDMYSPEQKAANQYVADAKGFGGKVKALIDRPSVALHGAIESAPSMLGGAGIGRVAAKVAPKLVGGAANAYRAAALGEGAYSAGSLAEGMREQNAEGLLTAGQAAASVLGGVGTGVIGAASGKLQKKLGWDDVEASLINKAAIGDKKKSLATRMIQGGVSEGAIEEMPQSMWEKGAENLGTGKQYTDGMLEAGAEGLITGGLMGVGGGGYQHLAAKQDKQDSPFTQEQLRAAAREQWPEAKNLTDAEVDALAAQRGAKIRQQPVGPDTDMLQIGYDPLLGDKSRVWGESAAISPSAKDVMQPIKLTDADILGDTIDGEYEDVPAQLALPAPKRNNAIMVDPAGNALAGSGMADQLKQPIEALNAQMAQRQAIPNSAAKINAIPEAKGTPDKLQVTNADPRQMAINTADTTIHNGPAKDGSATVAPTQPAIPVWDALSARLQQIDADHQSGSMPDASYNAAKKSINVAMRNEIERLRLEHAKSQLEAKMAPKPIVDPSAPTPSTKEVVGVEGYKQKGDSSWQKADSQSQQEKANPTPSQKVVYPQQSPEASPSVEKKKAPAKKAVRSKAAPADVPSAQTVTPPVESTPEVAAPKKPSKKTAISKSAEAHKAKQKEVAPAPAEAVKEVKSKPVPDAKAEVAKSAGKPFQIKTEGGDTVSVQAKDKNTAKRMVAMAEAQDAIPYLKREIQKAKDKNRDAGYIKDLETNLSEARDTVAKSKTDGIEAPTDWGMDANDNNQEAELADVKDTDVRSNKWSVAGDKKDRTYTRNQFRAKLAKERALATLNSQKLREWAKGKAGINIWDSSSEMNESNSALVDRKPLKSSMSGDMAEGFYDTKTGQIHIFANAIANITMGNQSRLSYVFSHELSHRGLRSLFGDKLNLQLSAVYAANKSTIEAGLPSLNSVRAKAKIAPINTDTFAGRLEAADEYLATLAGLNAEQRLGPVSRLLAAVRNLMRNIGFKLELTDNDILSMAGRSKAAGKTVSAEIADQKGVGLDETPKKSYDKNVNSIGVGGNIEVAPNPDDTAADAQWSAMPEGDKYRITGLMMKEFAGPVLEEFGFKEGRDYTISYIKGAYGSGINPSTDIVFKNPALKSYTKVREAIQALGGVLRQKEVVVYDTFDSKHEDASHFTAVTAVEGNIDGLYEALQQQFPQMVEGATIRGNMMAIGNFTRFGDNPVSDTEFHQMIKDVADKHDGKYKLDGFKFRSELLESTKLEAEDGSDRGQQLRTGQREVFSGLTREGRLRATQAKADARLAEHIKSAESGKRYSANPAGLDGSDGSRVQRTDERGFPVRADGRYELTHWSSKQGLTELDPSFHGNGISGAESKRKKNDPSNWVDRTYFGLTDGDRGYKKEPGLGSAKYVASIDPKELYDFGADPDGLKPKSMDWGQFSYSKYEKLVKEAGYKGYIVDHPQLGHVAALFDKVAPESHIDETTGDKRYSAPSEDAFPVAGIAGVRQLFAKRMADSMSAMGYDFKMSTRTLKYADDHRSYKIQYTVSRNGEELLIADRAIYESETYNGKLVALLSQANGLVVKDGRRTSKQAYKDIAAAELTHLSDLVDIVQSSLLGYGSSSWFQKNVAGAEQLKRGNWLTIKFRGEKPLRKVTSDQSTTAFGEELKNGEFQKGWTPELSVEDIDAIGDELDVEYPIFLDREPSKLFQRSSRAVGPLSEVLRPTRDGGTGQNQAGAGSQEVRGQDAADAGDTGARFSVAPRYGNELPVDFATVVREHPELVEKHAKAILGYKYTGIKFKLGEKPEQTVKRVIKQLSDNLVWLYGQISESERALSKQWYVGANKIAKKWAKEYGLTDDQSAAMIATMSPQMDWDQNLHLAKTIMDKLSNPESLVWNNDMSTSGYEAYRGLISGKDFADITNDNEKAAWLVAHDESMGKRPVMAWSPDGTEKGYGKLSTSWSNGAGPVAKAIRIFEGKDIGSNLGKYQKVRNFFNNIIDPTDSTSVTVDTHAVNAAYLAPLGGSSAEVLHNFGSGSKELGVKKAGSAKGAEGTYYIAADAYRDAAKKLGLLPRELQSIIWEKARRDISSIKGGTTKNEEVKNLWRQHVQGKKGYSPETVRAELAKYFGPSIGGDDSARYAADKSPVDQDALGRRGNGVGLGRRGAGDDTGRAGVKYSAPAHLTQQQVDAMKHVGLMVDKRTPSEWVAGQIDKWLGNWKQKYVDQFAPLQDLDFKAYLQARMSKGSDGALEAAIMYGNIQIKDGIYDAKATKGSGLIDAMQKLQGEHELFLTWIAANRADNLSREDKEHLFRGQDIKSLKRLNEGSMPDGQKRSDVYESVRKELKRINAEVLNVARDSGIIDPTMTKFWEDEFYVPFFRASEDGITGPGVSSGLVRQYAFKKLRGSDGKLHQDLMANVLMNWSHLLSAAAKNRAAETALKAAERQGVAKQVSSTFPKAVWYQKDGKRHYYDVTDPYIMEAITALEYTGSNGPGAKIMGKFKHYLTVGVTANPTFKIRNLIRDSIASMAISPLGYNLANNLRTGVAIMNDKQSQGYASLLASGGIIRFGTMLEGKSSSHIQRLIKAGVDPNTVLSSWEHAKGIITKGLDKYNDLGEVSEGANRAALYKQLRDQGVGHAEAAFKARDLLDFSMGGTSNVVRYLTTVVPFMNARIQGLYKLGKGAKEDPAKFASVIGVTALASILLMLKYRDDDEWKKREDWDRDNFWWFKYDNKAYRIPKPFEVGAIATLAERSLELMVNDEFHGKDFADFMLRTTGNTFAMNPVPQLFKPAIDIYANKNSFTGRDIESMGMEKLAKSQRLTGTTSEIARFLGKAEVFSPVQIDHMAKAYFGWLGTAALTVSDIAINPAMGRPEKADRKLRDTFLAGNFVEDLPTGSSKYTTQFYRQAREITEAYATYRNLAETGDYEKAASYAKDHGKELATYKASNNIIGQLANINKQIRSVENARNMDGKEKRRILDQLEQAKTSVTASAARGIKSVLG